MRIPFLNIEILKANDFSNILKQAQINNFEQIAARPQVNQILSLAGSDALPNYPVNPRMLYEMAYYSDVLRTIINALRVEIFRNGAEVKEKFVVKCTQCGKEFQHEDKDMRCDICGGQLREPNIQQKITLEQLVEKVNENEQTLLDVCKSVEDDLNIMDIGYFIVRKEYELQNNQIVDSKVVEIIRGDPLSMRIIADKTGRMGYDVNGKEIKVCIQHRDTPQDGTKCRICGLPLFRAYYKTRVKEAWHYYIKGEVLHVNKYSTLLYGFPPTLTLWLKLSTLLAQDRYIRLYYQLQRTPRGLLFIASKNAESFQKAYLAALETARNNPHAITPIVVENEGRALAEFIDLSHSLEEMQFTEVRNEFRRVIGGLYGVMPIFQADVETSGGLNQERLQITVTSRAVRSGQEIYNQKVFRWLLNQIGITDYEYVLKSVEMRDELREEEIKSAKITNAINMQALGFDINIDEEGNLVAVKRKTEETTAQEQTQAVEPQQFKYFGEDGAPIASLERSTDLIKEDMNDEDKIELLYSFAGKEINKEFIPRLRKEDKRKLKRSLFPRFKTMSKTASERIKSKFLDWLLRKVSLNELIEKIKKEGNVSEEEAERIARTESHELYSKLRELAYRDLDPEGERKYRWVGPQDHRTTNICKRIKQRTRNGVDLDMLKRIIKEEAEREGIEAREWTPHPNCRHTAVVVVE